MTRFVIASALTLALTHSLPAADWPQWMGPNRDDVWPEAGVVRTFPQGGPKVLWRVPIRGGYSGPAVAGGRVYVTDRAPKPGAMDAADPFAGGKAPVPSVERVLCLDARTGQEKWKYEYDVTYQIQYPVGPRCTPTVSDGKVYTLGAVGDLLCLEADTGKVVWSKNLPKDYSAQIPVWGFAGHPVVYKNLVISLVGAEKALFVAFDKATGKEVWKALSVTDAGAGYNTPALIEAGGTTQLVVWTPRRLHGLNPDSGAEYWNVPLVPDHGMSIMSPRKHGDLLFVGGIGNVAVVLRLDPARPAVTEVWRAKGGPKADAGVLTVKLTTFLVE
jgi:outer membrane protein assembly factor BamB